MISSVLRAGVGVSEAAEAREAGYLAAVNAIERLQGEPAALVLVYTSIRYDLPELLAGIRDVTGETPLVGATSSGQFHPGGFTRPGQGVTVMALTAGPYRFGIGVAEGLNADAEGAGRELVRTARRAAGPDLPAHAALLILTDGLTGDHQRVVNGIYGVTGAAVPVVGGAASDDFAFQRTFVLHGGRLLTDAAVAVWIGSDHPLKVVTRHGWRAVSLPLLVTRAEGHIVHEIGGRPVLEVYREHVQLQLRPDMETPPPGMYVPEHATHAFGLIEPDGSQLIRAVMIDSDGALKTSAPLPDYAAIQIVSCFPDDLLDASDEVAATALGSAAVDGGGPSALLAFSCVARLTILGDRAPEESRRIQTAAGSVPAFGFYTYGEFARTASISGFHNASVTAIAL